MRRKRRSAHVAERLARGKRLGRGHKVKHRPGVRRQRPFEGRVEIGVRPEFARLSDSEGLPVKVRRIEDVGRHKIIRADCFGTPINIIADEAEEVRADATRVAFDPAHVNVYANDWRVTPEGRAA